MGRWMRGAVLPLIGVVGLLVIAGVAVASDDATITLGVIPEPPECVEPGEVQTIFWTVDYGTTPDFVYYALLDPDMQVVEEETYPGDSGVDVTREWLVPADAPEGQYWVHIEYWSEEVGHEADANVCFLVCCGNTPAEGHGWGAVKSLFR